MKQQHDFAAQLMSDALIQHLAQPALVLNSDGVITRVNAAFSYLVSDGPTALMGRNMCTVLDPVAGLALKEFMDLSNGATSLNDDPGLAVHLNALGATMQVDIHAVQNHQTGALAYLCLGQLKEPKDKDDDVSRNWELRWRVAVESAGHAVWDTAGPASRFVTDNWFAMRGLERAVDVQDQLARWIDWVHPDDRPHVEHAIERQNRGEVNGVDYQYRHRHGDGHWVWILSKGRVISRDMTGKPRRVIGIDTDITELKRMEFASRDLSDRLQVTLDVADIGLWDLKPSTGALQLNNIMFEMCGLDPSGAAPTFESWLTLVHVDDRDNVRAAIDDCLREQNDFRINYRIGGADETTRHLRMSGKYIFGGSEHAASIFGVNIDMTSDVLHAQEIEAARLQFEHDSRHDALTGLANRRLLDERFAEFAGGKKFKPHSVLQIDIDYFKQINDNFGHIVGDKVLRHIADVTTSIVGNFGLVARVGGDEIVVLIPSKIDADVLFVMAKEIVQQVAKPFVVDGKDCGLGVSIGVATAKRLYPQPERVFANADMALYLAKQAGRSCVRVFNDTLRKSLKAEENLLKDLIEAIKNRDLTCHYQPQFDAKSRKLVGLEALVRWPSVTRA